MNTVLNERNQALEMLNKNQAEVNNFNLYVWEFKFHEVGNSHSVLLNADTCSLRDETTRLNSLMGAGGQYKKNGDI